MILVTDHVYVPSPLRGVCDLCAEDRSAHKLKGTEKVSTKDDSRRYCVTANGFIMDALAQSGECCALFAFGPEGRSSLAASSMFSPHRMDYSYIDAIAVCSMLNAREMHS